MGGEIEPKKAHAESVVPDLVLAILAAGGIVTSTPLVASISVGFKVLSAFKPQPSAEMALRIVIADAIERSNVKVARPLPRRQRWKWGRKVKDMWPGARPYPYADCVDGIAAYFAGDISPTLLAKKRTQLQLRFGDLGAHWSAASTDIATTAPNGPQVSESSSIAAIGEAFRPITPAGFMDALTAAIVTEGLLHREEVLTDEAVKEDADPEAIGVWAALVADKVLWGIHNNLQLASMAELLFQRQQLVQGQAIIGGLDLQQPLLQQIADSTQQSMRYLQLLTRGIVLIVGLLVLATALDVVGLNDWAGDSIDWLSTNLSD